ncbi:MAG: xanthine dehydrogenase family protein molybdopterin-binding subunit [Ahniella sp.]|nr:xanthine dehydrogenase family protein molybdopterin-binding subunit [Ahniella sp.]
MLYARTLPPALASRQSALSLSRRQFIFGASLVGTAFLVGCSSSGPETPAATAATTPGGPAPFEAYVGIAADGTVTVYSSQFDMGQNAYHGLATLVAEELEVALDRVLVEGRAGNPKWYGNLAMGGAFQLTGGSSSMASSWDRYRQAGAMAREMLKQAAAQKLGVEVASLTAVNGEIVHAESGQKVAYGDLASAAAALPVPAAVALKDKTAWTLIGKDSTDRIDGLAKSTGTLTYTIDLKLPGMLYAAMVHSPRFGGTVKSVNDAAAREVAGVVDVVTVSRGVAVVASNTWAAFQGRKALQVEWDFANAETRSTDAMFKEYEKLAAGPGMPAAQKGDAAAALARATKVIEADYRFPYLAHAALEPLNALIHKDGERLNIYGGLQMPDAVQAACAGIAAVNLDQVDLHVMKTGGGFGRRAVPDCDVFVEATEIAKAIGFRAPVLLQWTRETDMAGGRYRPLHVHRVRVGLDAEGRISGWQHHVVGQSIFAGTPFAGFLKNGIDPSSLEGIEDTPYALPDVDLQVSHPSSQVPVLWWRSVGHTHTAFVMETMIDEIASINGEDPIALRLKLLPENARQRAVLNLAAEKAGWNTPAAEGRFRGIAVHQSFGSFVATVAEVSKAADGAIKVERCVVASDCGLVINPDVVRAQVEGGTAFGLSAVLGERLTLLEGGAEQTNFDGYSVLRMDQMPEVSLHMLASAEAPTGIGECAVPPIGPAVADAIVRATGQRLRQLPFRQA